MHYCVCCHVTIKFLHSSDSVENYNVGFSEVSLSFIPGINADIHTYTHSPMYVHRDRNTQIYIQHTHTIHTYIHTDTHHAHTHVHTHTLTHFSFPNLYHCLAPTVLVDRVLHDSAVCHVGFDFISRCAPGFPFLVLRLSLSGRSIRFLVYDLAGTVPASSCFPGNSGKVCVLCSP